jgi:predicted acylesterase/phospholipase RssA
MGNPIKVLSMDGGNGINTALLLQRLETASPHQNFLNQADVFAGTSAGGINALFFAAADKPADALAHIQQFWMEVNHSILDGLKIKADEAVRSTVAGAEQKHALNPATQDHWQELGAEILRTALGIGETVTGFRSLFLNDLLKKFLSKYFGENTTLASLKRGVITVTFELDNRKLGIDRSWVPRLFTNLPSLPTGQHGAMKKASAADANERIVDVAMRTSAAPLELPIYQSTQGGTGHSGYVDGGLVANNPAMVALSSIVGTLFCGTHHHKPQAPAESLSQVHMLSVGTGRNLVGKAQYLAPEFTNGSAAWGYRHWLLDPSNPLVLIDAFLQAGNEAAAWECEIMLGAKQFHRLNVPLERMCVIGDPETEARVARAAEWLTTTDWFSAGPRGLTAI